LNAYYDPVLKEARLSRLRHSTQFVFHRIDVADRDAMFGLAEAAPDVDRVVHLAAQAGVRYSLIDPWAYVDANVRGQLTVIEACRRLPAFRHLVYASSSSVYGANTTLPFAVTDAVDQPISVYAASKRAAELFAETYAHLHRMPMTGLRFFSVYGPWGRPDMAAYLFTAAILAGEPIQVFNAGDMSRDFTYIDDIVAGVLAALDRPPSATDADSRPPHRIYNLGNHRAEDLNRFIALLEDACGRRAIREPREMQPGDVRATYADIESAQRDLGFTPSTPIDVGIQRFVTWYRRYHGV
jgi:UDP-glucuronate 4-epimerase